MISLNQIIWLSIILIPLLFGTQTYSKDKGFGGVVCEEIKRAMNKMGPYKNYKIEGTKLYVEVDKEWRRLKY